MDLSTKFFGFVDEVFWICRRKFLDLSTIFFGFVSVGVRFSGENYNDNDKEEEDNDDNSDFEDEEDKVNKDKGLLTI